jgi:hypothetical protein
MFEAYLMGKFTNVIWDEDWDANYFWMIQPICLGKVIHDMYKVNLKV